MVELSLIVPCYNEGKTLDGSLEKIHCTLKKTAKSFELILIDDKSGDKTPEKIKKFAKGKKSVKAVLHKKNKGRGHTVKEGLKLAKGNAAGYIDVDLEIPAESIIPHYRAIAVDGFDVAYANRHTKLGLSKLHRHFLHKGYIWLSKLLLGTPFNDTNAGCKFFKRKKILPLLEKTKSNHWFWDTEILALSHYSNLKMKEIPALYIKKKEKKSTVKVCRDTLYFLKKLWGFRAKKGEFK